MDIDLFTQVSEFEWRIEPTGAMRVPAIIYADEPLVADMDDKVYEQVTGVATLPGIVEAAYAMPDAHWGYGFPIGGVAAFDPDEGGVISAGGVGFDISCGVRTLKTNLTVDDLRLKQAQVADALFAHVPAGVGSTGAIHLDGDGMTRMLAGGAQWAVEQGYGNPKDLDFIEDGGCIPDADPQQVSEKAKRRQRDEMGTLGSGNHYLEVQQVVEVHDRETATAFGLAEGNLVITIHCGSRGLGHQIGTEFLRKMVIAAAESGILLPDRELACAPIRSKVGQDYIGAMRAAMNCALANRQIITHLTRETIARFFPEAELALLYDVSHNTCKEETHMVGDVERNLFVHRKGATRSFGPGHPDLPKSLRKTGQPVLIGGSMGTASYILVGTRESLSHAFGSACHGAGRRMSRRKAKKIWQGRQVTDELAARGILIRSATSRGVAEEAPGAYKDVSEVVLSAEHAGLARRVARVEPVICVKG